MNWKPYAVACAGLLLLSQNSPGQTPSSPVQPLPATSTETPPAVAALTQDRQWFAVDLLLGAESGMRGQVALWHGDHSSIVAEGFYGYMLTKFGSSESAGGGARWLIRRESLDGKNAFVFGPGVNLIQEFRSSQALILAPTIDVQWVRSIGLSAEWQAGLQLGPGFDLTDNRTPRRNSSSRATPLISVFTGFRF